MENIREDQAVARIDTALDQQKHLSNVVKALVELGRCDDDFDGDLAASFFLRQVIRRQMREEGNELIKFILNDEAS